MSPAVAGLLLIAAFLHAAWNAILRSGGDRLWSISVICAMGAIAALPFALLLAPPARPSWGYLALSALLQMGYCLFLVRAYRDAHLAHVYPIARGTAPLLVTIGAAIFAHDVISPQAMLGVALVSWGIITLTLGASRPDTRSTIAAVTTGLFIASYMVVDGIGVRVARNAAGYAAWQAVTAGILMPFVYLVIRRRAPALPRGKSGALVIAAALFGVLGYCVAIWAMSLAPMGQVSALRETSILFAVLIGAVALREQVTPQKAVGAITITAGIVFLAAG